MWPQRQGQPRPSHHLLCIAEQRCPANSLVEPIIWDNTIGAVVIAAIWLILIELISCSQLVRLAQALALRSPANIDPAPSLVRGAAAMRLNAVSDAAAETILEQIHPIVTL